MDGWTEGRTDRLTSARMDDRIIRRHYVRRHVPAG